MTDAPPLVRCSGAARTYGAGQAATVALQPTDCVVPEGARRTRRPVRFGQVDARASDGRTGRTDRRHRRLAGARRPRRPTPRPGRRDLPGTEPAAPTHRRGERRPPLVLGGLGDAAAHNAARIALDLLDLADLADKLPEEISGGQAQRVAVTRALAGRPRLILADEPTGQLDRESSIDVIDVLLAAADHAGAGLVVCTHDPQIAARLDRHWSMRDGRLEADRTVEATWSR